MSEVKVVDIRSLVDSYEFRCVLPGSGQELKIKPITTGQMKKILAYEQEEDPYVIEDALDSLISDCVLSENFDINELYLQDRFFLLLELRKVSKGNSYSYTFSCPKCGQENVGAIDLTTLTVKKKENKDSVIKINDKLSFEVDFPKRKDQKEALKYVKKKGKLTASQKDVEAMTATLALSVTKVHTPDGVIDDVPVEDKIYILDNVRSDVFNNFKAWFDDNEFGIDFKTSIKCGFCPNEQIIDIPIADFFG